MTAPHRLAAAFLVAVAGCGGDHATESRSTAFVTLASEISTAAGRHRQNMQVVGASGCTAETSRYAGEIGPMLDRMQGLSGDMDSCMTATGRVDAADMLSTCEAMRAELGAHVAGGCAAPDPLAEAARHATVMQQMAAHEMQRAGSMGGMGPGSTMMSGHCGG